jgi:hypothetical protein
MIAEPLRCLVQALSDTAAIRFDDDGRLFDHVPEFWGPFENLLCEWANRIYLQAIFARVFGRGTDQLFSDTLVAKFLINLGVIDSHRIASLEICKLGDPLAIFIDIERALPPVFVLLDLHITSITANGRSHCHHFVQENG